MDTKSTITLFDRANSQLQNTTFQHSHHHQLYIFTSNEQEPACHTHKNFPPAEVTHCCCSHCWNSSPIISLCSALFAVQKPSASINECQWEHFILYRGIQFHTFASYILPFQTPFCQTAPLLPSVIQQQKKKGTLVGRFSFYCHTTNIHLWHCGPA